MVAGAGMADAAAVDDGGGKVRERDTETETEILEFLECHRMPSTELYTSEPACSYLSAVVE